MKKYFNTGTALVIAGLILLISLLNINSYRLSEASIQEAFPDSSKAEAIISGSSGMINKIYHSKFTFIKDFRKSIAEANDKLQKDNQDTIDDPNLPSLLKTSIEGPLADHTTAFLFVILD